MRESTSPLEKAAKAALSAARGKTVEFRLLEDIAEQNGVSFQRLLSVMDVAGRCELDYDTRQATCPTSPEEL